jgi:hypothetical protein
MLNALARCGLRAHAKDLQFVNTFQVKAEAVLFAVDFKRFVVLESAGEAGSLQYIVLDQRPLKSETKAQIGGHNRAISPSPIGATSPVAPISE